MEDVVLIEYKDIFGNIKRRWHLKMELHLLQFTPDCVKIIETKRINTSCEKI